MNCRALLLTALLCVPFAGIGCAGPTKTGIENRQKANDRLDSFHAQMAYDQASDAFKVGQFKEAQLALANAIERYPDNADFHLLNGRIFLEQSRLEDAARAFSTAIEKDEEHAEAHYMLGVVFQRWSNDEKAYEAYSVSYQLENSNTHYLLATAESLVALKRYDEVTELVTPRLDYFENNAALHHLLGQVQLLQGNMQAAVPWYREARLLRPDDLMMHKELIRVLFDAGAFEECYDNLLEYRASNAGNDEAEDLRMLEARCLALLGRSTDSRNLYLKLSRDMPTNVDVWSEMGALAWELGDYRRVALCSVRIMALAPDRYEGYMLRGINEQHHGHHQEALEYFQRATERADDSVLPHLLLGVALEEQGNQGDALVAYGNALRINPDSMEAQSLFSNLSREQITAVPTDH
ncbi:MAG: tetratricopeptide repeat protein [Planctomycetota bacterium]